MSAPYTIGRLAKLSGLSVKTIRFYSDIGVLPERGRTAGGYRLYGEEDVARLELVRVLRDMGVDLTTIRSLGERGLAEVLRLHLRVVETRLRGLQRTRAVLRATLDRGDPTEADLRRLHALGRLGGQELTELLDDFLADVGGGNEARRRWLACLRDAMLPELPDEPTAGQLDAWLELVTLLADDDFRTRLRESSDDYWRDAEHRDLATMREANQAVIELALAAVREGVAPDSPEAAGVLDRIMAQQARAYDSPDGPEVRERLLRAYDEHDPRAERYWELISIITGTPWSPGPGAAHAWIAAALRHDVACRG